MAETEREMFDMNKNWEDKMAENQHATGVGHIISLYMQRVLGFLEILESP